VQASWRLYDHVKAGDMGQAFVALAEGYGHALNVVTPPFVGSRQLAGALVRSRASRAMVVDTATAAPRAAVVFEPRFKVKNLRKPGTPDHEGIYRVDGQAYIRHDGSFYTVHYHDEYATWRLARADGTRLHEDITGPAIERVDGQWQFNHDVGLRGGMRRIRDRFRRVLRVQEEAAPVAPVAQEPPPAVVVPPRERPAPRPYPALPEALEHLRDQIVADARLNPSAQYLYRPDGSSAYFDVRTRSAMIHDPNLAPDLAALSPNQRRAFLHEMEGRFPQLAERSEVLNARGWARHEGRRAPSPEGAGAIDEGVQSPVISSSESSAPSSPRLSRDQEIRWNEALTAAQRVPENVPLGASHLDLVPVETLPRGDVVPLDQWPSRIWYFTESRPRMDAWVRNNPAVVLVADAPPGTRRSQALTTMPPETPVARLRDTLGVSEPRAGQRDPLKHWVEIHLDAVRNTASNDATRIGFELRRRTLPSGEFHYTIESTRAVSIPAALVTTGHRVPRPGEARFRNAQPGS
jgi:hypothetical protein